MHHASQQSSRIAIPLRRAMFAALLVASAAFAACSPYDTTEEYSLGMMRTEKFPVLLVREPIMTTVHRPADLYQYTSVLLERLAFDGRIPVVAPWEAEIDEGEEWPHNARQISEVLSATGVDPDSALLLEFRINEASTRRDVEQPEAFGGGLQVLHIGDVEVELTAEEFHSRRQVAHITVAFEEKYSYDPLAVTGPRRRPVLENGIRAAADMLIERYHHDFEDGPIGSPAPLEGFFNPEVIFTYGGGAGGRLIEETRGMDVYEMLDYRIGWYTRLYDGLDPEIAAYFANNPGSGFYVTDAQPIAEAAGLMDGDYIVRVERKPVLSNVAIQRTFLTMPPRQTVRMVVQRDGEEHRVEVPVP